MTGPIATFLAQHRQELLVCYVTAVVLTALAFAWLVHRWARWQERVPSTGQDLTARRGLPPGLAVTMGVMFLLLSLPFFVQNLERLGPTVRENPGRLAILLFPALGVGLVVTGLRGLRRGRSGQKEFVLDSVVIRPGGLVSGRYRIARIARDPRPVRIHLVLQKTRLARLRHGERQLEEHALWTATREVRPQRRGAITEIPFLFRLPATLPERARVPGRTEWVMVLEGRELGNRIHMVRAETTETPARLPSTRTASGSRPSAGAPSPTTDSPAALPTPTLLASGGSQNPMVSLAMGLFVFVFPWLMWFLMDEADQPWLHLDEALPPMLFRGFVALSLFSTALFWLLCRHFNVPGSVRLWRRMLRLSLMADAAIAVWLGHELVVHGLPHWGSFSEALGGVVEPVGDALIGMFLWVGAITLARVLSSLLRGPSRSGPVAR